MGAMEVAERRGEAMVDRPGDTDPQPTVEHPAQGRDLLAATLGRSKSRAGMGQERLTRAGEGHGAPIAVEERLPELTLEAPDLRADGRLGDRYAGRRARELSLLGDRDEVRELPQVHKDSLCRSY
jgi:hypothetical protein